MRVSSLYAPNGPFVGKDIYIVGQGPSMAVFPLRWLEDKTCILLNDTQKYFQRLGPIAIANSKEFLKPLSSAIKYQIIKGRMKHDGGAERDDNHVPWDHPDIYVFSYYSPEWGEPDSRDISMIWSYADHYWIGGTVAVYGVQFAARAGARSITFVGCDGCTLLGRHYHVDGLQKQRKPNSRAITKSLIRSGKPPPGPRDFVRDYPMYIEGMLAVKQEVEKRFGIPVMTLSPFVGVQGMDEQYRKLLSWR